ncbi:MAG: ribonuclease P protein component [Candidatus Paceibacterota bacterium]|jgi:ribonuclease P protein component
MLKKSQRLNTKQFDEVIKRGKLTPSKFFLIRVLQDAEYTKVSVVMPKKILGKASKRNRSRRVMYEAVGSIFDTIPTNLHAIIIAKSDISGIKQEEMKKDLISIFAKPQSRTIKPNSV